MNKNNKKGFNKPATKQHNVQNPNHHPQDIPFSPNRPGIEYRKVEQKSNNASNQLPHAQGQQQSPHLSNPQNRPLKQVKPISQNTPTIQQRSSHERPAFNTQPPKRSKPVAKKAPIETQDMARQRALNAHRKRVQKQIRAKRLKVILRKAAIISLFSTIGATLCFVAVFVVLKINFSKNDLPKELSVELVQNSKEPINVSLKNPDYEYKNGVYYISITALQKNLGFSVSGDVKETTIKLSDKQSATFTVNSTTVKINGTYVTMDNASYFDYSNSSLYVPATFFKDFCSGVTFEADSSDKDRVFKLIFPETLEFVCQETSPTPPISSPSAITTTSNTSNSDEEVKTPAFLLDLSEYEMYMNPQNRDEYLILINTSNKLSPDYTPNDLTDFIYTKNDRKTQLLRLYAAKSLEAMFKEMYAHGYTDVAVTSGYRSYSYQTDLFNNEVDNYRATYGNRAEEKAAEAVAIPGSSEHQSGLCADLHNLESASTAFEKQEAFKWIYAHCADFGFILRFPKDKTDITGIMYEPWHYRYVGRYHAQKIMSSGLCLEEYIAQYNGG